MHRLETPFVVPFFFTLHYLRENQKKKSYFVAQIVLNMFSEFSPVMWINVCGTTYIFNCFELLLFHTEQWNYGKYQCDKSSINLQWNDMVSFHCRLISSFHAGTTFFYKFGLSFFSKRLSIHRPVWHYATDVSTSNQASDVILQRHIWARATLKPYAASFWRQLQTAVLNRRIFLACYTLGNYFPYFKLKMG